MNIVIAWVATAIAFGIADAIFLSQVAQRVYRPLIGEILRPDVGVAAAAAFYAIYVSGLVFFAVAPALEKQSLGVAVLNAAVLGFVAYATYDLTNQATMRVWDLRVTLLDMAWGTFASALAAAIAYLCVQRLTT
jgi:uncharacterized membrane protein